MRGRHQIGELTRRRALTLAGGFGLAPLSGTFAAAADPNAPIMTRPIPSSGERLPMVGLGTDQDWRTDTPEYRAALSAILRTLIAGGGSVVDTASNSGGYGLDERMLGEIFAESGLPIFDFEPAAKDRSRGTVQGETLLVRDRDQFVHSIIKGRVVSGRAASP
jgi:hypothetical protein